MWLKASALPGANRLLKHLRKHGVPFALASNSIRKHIEVKISCQKGWKESFSVILGSDQVKSGKPSPDLFLEAAKRMNIDATCCLVIEDSLVGVKAAKAAKMKVVAVPSLQSNFTQYSISDCVLNSLLEFQPELWGLPPFEDWVDAALPIEPIHFKGFYRNELLTEISEIGNSPLPDQVSGIYFGWAEVDSSAVFEIVISFKWYRGCCISSRNIQACLVDQSTEQTWEEPWHITLIGYIRGFSEKENTSADARILKKDLSIARSSLCKPAFAYRRID